MDFKKKPYGWLVKGKYRLVDHFRGQYLCTCQGFMFSGYCQHIRAIQFARGEIESMYDLTDIKGIGEVFKAKLVVAGITGLVQLAAANAIDVAQILGDNVGEDRAKEFVKAAKKTAEKMMEFKDAFEDFERMKIIRGHVTTGSKHLDTLIDPYANLSAKHQPKLHGGIETFSLNSICGPYGCGKTQIAHQLAVNAQLPMSLGGLRGEDPVKVCYIETESGTFRHERIIEMAKAMELDPDDVLKNILLIRAFTVDEQYIAYTKVGANAIRMNIRMVIVDSFSARFRESYTGRETFSARAKDLIKHLEYLNRLAFEQNMAVVLTHQVYGTPTIYSTGPTIWGGHTVTHVATLHLKLEIESKSDDKAVVPWAKVKATVVDHPAIPKVSTNFYIVPDGIRDKK